MRDHVCTRIDQLPILPELRALLMHMVQHDDECSRRIILVRSSRPFRCCLAQAIDVTPFTAAWRLMYAAISRLDELQDNDPISDRAIVALDRGLQYNLILTYYALASSVLDDLDPQRIPYQRIHRLRRAWSDSMLRMAGGQQRDLLGVMHADTTPLVAYQELAQAKTGATFALAFGGMAMLCSDDNDLIQRLTLVGEIYGTLLQYSDDLLDQHEPNQTLTLPQALVQTYGTVAQQPHTSPRRCYPDHTRLSGSGPRAHTTTSRSAHLWITGFGYTRVCSTNGRSVAMIAPHATPTRLAAGVSSTDSHIMSLHGVAAGTLMVLLIALLVIWPIPYLGFSVDLATGTITEVVPGSAADRAQLVVADRIVGMYDYAWSDIERRTVSVPDFLAGDHIRSRASGTRWPDCVGRHPG